MIEPSQFSQKTIAMYDGGCGVCRREIQLLRRLDRHGRVQWVDINNDMSLLNALGVSYDQAMRRFHVLDGTGILRVGAPAMLALWSAVPGFSLFARLVYATRSVKLLERGYEWFAERRFDARMTRVTCEVR